MPISNCSIAKKNGVTNPMPVTRKIPDSLCASTSSTCLFAQGRASTAGPPAVN